MSTVRVEHCPECGQMIGEGMLYQHQQQRHRKIPPDVDSDKGVCGNCDQRREIYLTTDDDVDLCRQCYEELREDMMVRNLKPIPPVSDAPSGAHEREQNDDRFRQQLATARGDGVQQCKEECFWLPKMMELHHEIATLQIERSQADKRAEALEARLALMETPQE